MAGDNTLTFTDSDFDRDVLNSDVPVLVDFWAEWCGPCRMMTPTIDALASDNAGRAKIGKLNVDENGASAMRYNVRGIPTLLLFKSGKVVEQVVGTKSKSDLQALLDRHLTAPEAAAPVAPRPVQQASSPNGGAPAPTPATVGKR